MIDFNQIDIESTLEQMHEVPVTMHTHSVLHDDPLELLIGLEEEDADSLIARRNGRMFGFIVERK